jgi:hypothetical protein
MSGPRADIPREGSTFYPPGGDPIRASSPFAPVSGTLGAAPRVPLLGIAIVAGVVLLFEHFRNKRGK